MAGEGVGQRRGVSDDSSGWGSDSDFDELSQRHSQACSAGGGSQSVVSSPVPASAANSAPSTDATPPSPYASDDPDFNDADNTQQAGTARWRARTSRSSRPLAPVTAALGRVSFPWAKAGITCTHTGKVRTAAASRSPRPPHPAELDIPVRCGPGVCGSADACGAYHEDLVIFGSSSVRQRANVLQLGFRSA